MLAAVTVRVIAAVLAAAAVCSGIIQLVGAGGSDPASSDVASAISSYRYEQPKELLHLGGATPLRFLIRVTGVNPEEKQIEATATAIMADAGGPPVLVDDSRKPIYGEPHGVRKEFANLGIGIQIFSGLDGGGTTVRFPLSKLVSINPGDESDAVPFSVPADVAPQSYPNDSYAVDLTVSAILPSSVWIADRADRWFYKTGKLASNISTTNAPPVVFGVAQGVQLTQWQMRTNRTVTADIQRQTPINISVVIERTWSYWLFVYAVSLMPAVLGFAFWVRMRSNRKAEISDASGAMELAAALIALLTLRQVFVPPDISGLTRLDILLGVQLLGVCFLVANDYVRVSAPGLSTKDAARASAAGSPLKRLRGVPPMAPNGAIPRRWNVRRTRSR